MKCIRHFTEQVLPIPIRSQESTDLILINEAYMDEVPLRFMGQDVSPYQQPLSIDSKRSLLLLIMYY